MVIPEKMKTNRFKDVRIPSGQELINMYLGREIPEHMYTGEESQFIGRKTEQLENAKRELEQKFAETDE